MKSQEVHYMDRTLIPRKAQSFVTDFCIAWGHMTCCMSMAHIRGYINAYAYILSNIQRQQIYKHT